MSSKKYKKKLCVYCATAPSTSADHVFAREFFLPEDRADLPKVPACAKCNKEKSDLEHYLTAVLPFGGRHDRAGDNLREMVPGRLGKNASLHQRLKKGWGRTWVEDDSGLVIPVSTVPLDPASVEKLFAMVAQGLVWFHWETNLTTEHVVRVGSCPIGC